ncbi:hypothetical protein GXP67_34740 [Rhodocytophaga rosea]|uniref:Secretion system C-terminal sorting domain-containing protein n=1 Tax=Rhodocytophaga rosea TaxID=2704465 RepID=A0A6C0GV65_9BACT|nr:T9SS type A sorting domain-containing protein [Rhodocytophaga rosea]QHT71453.1 hypothetical protein GXP67_34740 [Rhodocytophaga rosea]
MRKYLHFDLVVGYFFVFAIIMLCQSFTLKATASNNKPEKNVVLTLSARQSDSKLHTVSVYSNSSFQTFTKAQTDSLDFEVKLVKPRKFLLSFYKKQASDIFIKIYDVLGNLVHQEKVSKKGKFKKEYDLSAYKTELYVIEVSDSNNAKAKRLFMG